MPAAYHQTAKGVALHVRVTPNAGMDRIEEVHVRDNDTAVLHIKVRAVPDKGQANKAVIALVAKTLRVPKTSITVKSGKTARFKTLEITANFADLVPELAQMCPNAR